jgi:hypothetical protein
MEVWVWEKRFVLFKEWKEREREEIRLTQISIPDVSSSSYTWIIETL